MISRLIEKIQKTAPIVVGLDPQLKFIPEQLLKASYKEIGENPEGVADAIFKFNKGIVDAVYDIIPAVKPQIAMYEVFGIPGLIAFDKTVKYCREKGLVVIGDIKRGDIGSTSAAYAQGHIGSVEIGGKKFEDLRKILLQSIRISDRTALSLLSIYAMQRTEGSSYL